MSLPDDTTPSMVAEKPDLWDRRYADEGHIWGNDSSPTADLLRDTIRNQPGKGPQLFMLCDIGCGYGRDALKFAAAGHTVLAIDPSKKGLELASATQRQLNSEGLMKGSVTFMHGTMAHVLDAHVGHFDAIYSHRTIHLLDPKPVDDFAVKAAERIVPGGFLCIGARSPKDFNPEQMKALTVHGKTVRDAVYTDKKREGHVLHFWDKARFREVFARDFNIKQFVTTTELEAVTNPGVMTSLLIMLAQRKTNGSTPKVSAG